MMQQQWIDKYHREIETFAQDITAFQEGALDRKAYKGRSGGMGSYAQRDPAKHMLRLRMPGGRLTKERLNFLARAVADFQVDKLKLTTCETIQLHDLAYDQVPVLVERALEGGIYCKGGGGDNPRNAMCSPLSGTQPGEAFDVMPWAEAATEYLLSICRDIHMPRKLKVAFCNGVDDCVHTAFRDMGFQAQPDGTFSLRIAGGLGANHRMGVLVEESLPANQVLYYVKAMIDLFCAHGNYENRGKARTRYLQETLGDRLKETYLEAVAAAKKVGGLDLDITPTPVTKAGEGTLSHPRVLAQKQPGLYTVAYHPIGGMLPPEKPAQLAALLEGMPQVEGRIAPDETLYFIHLTAAEARQLLEATQDGAQTEFEHSVSCIGAAICQQGVRDSQGLLRAAVAAVRGAELPDGALPKICISGCPSSCSAHQAAPIGFQGCVKLVDKMPLPAFRMFLGGSDALGAAHFGEPVATVLERDIPTLLVKLGQAAAAEGLSWDQWLETHPDAFQAILDQYA